MGKQQLRFPRSIIRGIKTSIAHFTLSNNDRGNDSLFIYGGKNCLKKRFLEILNILSDGSISKPLRKFSTGFELKLVKRSLCYPILDTLCSQFWTSYSGRVIIRIFKERIFMSSKISNAKLQFINWMHRSNYRFIASLCHNRISIPR